MKKIYLLFTIIIFFTQTAYAEITTTSNTIIDNLFERYSVPFYKETNDFNNYQQQPTNILSELKQPGGGFSVTQNGVGRVYSRTLSTGNNCVVLSGKNDTDYARLDPTAGTYYTGVTAMSFDFKNENSTDKLFFQLSGGMNPYGSYLNNANIAGFYFQNGIVSGKYKSGDLNSNQTAIISFSYDATVFNRVTVLFDWQNRHMQLLINNEKKIDCYFNIKNDFGNDTSGLYIKRLWAQSTNSTSSILIDNIGISTYSSVPLKIPEINPFEYMETDSVWSLLERRQQPDYLFGVINGETFSKLIVTDESSTVTLKSNPTHGTAQIIENKLYYTVIGNYTGNDEFYISAGNKAGISDKQVRIINYPSVSQAKTILGSLKSVSRPRIKATKADFDKVKFELSNGDVHIIEWYNMIKAKADYYKDKTFVYDPSYENKQPGSDNWFMGITRPVLSRLEPLAFMYQMTGDTGYADAVWRDISILCDVPNLYKIANVTNTNSWSYDVCMLANAEAVDIMAVAYDWLYDYLTDNQKTLMRKTVREQSFSKAILQYNGSPVGVNWQTETSNWGAVCNGGLLVGALAFGNDDDMLNESSIIYSNALKGITYQLGPFSKGGYTETPTYWAYASRYLTYALSSMDKSLGTVYGLETIDDTIKNSVKYALYTSGEQWAYNTGDAWAGFTPAANSVMWIISKYKQYQYVQQFNKYITYYAKQSDSKREITPFELLWYDNEMYKTKTENALDALLDNPNANSVSLRSEFSDNATEIFLHGAQNQSLHGHLDMGTVFVDMLGERWFEDGFEVPYGISGVWDFGKNSNRWKVFNARAESHSTILVGPDAGEDQNPFAASKIYRTGFGTSGSFGAIDMTEAYPKAQKVIRGIKIFDDRRKVIIQDEITTLPGQDIYWNIATKADIQIIDNGKTVVLSKNGKQVALRLLSPYNAEFKSEALMPFSSSPPQPIGSIINDNAKRISIALNNVIGDTKITVGVEPYYNDTVQTEWGVTNIDNWTAETGYYNFNTNVKLNINGNQLIISPYIKDIQLGETDKVNVAYAIFKKYKNSLVLSDIKIFDTDFIEAMKYGTKLDNFTVILPGDYSNDKYLIKVFSLKMNTMSPLADVGEI